MKRIYSVMLFAGLFLYAGLGRLQAQQTTSFNFSVTSKTVSGWTNVTGDPVTAVRTGTDATTGISISSVATANWSAYLGACAHDSNGVSNGTFFPAGVMYHNWYQYSTTLANYNAAVPQLIISGLNIDSVYTIKMSGSSTSGFTSNPTRYTISGVTVYGYVDINAHNNITAGATFNNIAPDATGKIKIYVNTTSASQVADICGIQIIRQRTVAPVPVVTITSPENNDILLEDDNVTINATATETGGAIKKVEFYANGTKLGDDSVAPYSYTWPTPNEGNYTVTARAIDTAGSTGTYTINISVQPLSSFWSMTGNINMNPDSNFIGNVDSVRLAFRTKNLERMSLSATGNLGIGITAPTAQLHTTGSVRLAGLTSDSTKARVLVSDTSGNLYYRSVTSLSGRWQYANGTLYDSSDNIAIGTNNPQGYKLAVNGTAIFTKVKVKTAGTWPDYVFKPGYELPDLVALEKYLQEHRHLPGIVSESEVAKDGIDVGDHQAALLKKVEELTLYLIEENKRLKAQNEQLQKQQSLLEKLQQQVEALQQAAAGKK